MFKQLVCIFAFFAVAEALKSLSGKINNGLGFFAVNWEYKSYAPSGNKEADITFGA